MPPPLTHRRPTLRLAHARGAAGGALLGLFAALVTSGCSTVPVDSGPGNRVIPPAGVIEGTVLYQGPPPCSENGHIVGNMVLLFFNQNDPPPPAGIASTAAQLGVVAGDVLFQNEVRSSGSKYCPSTSTQITASAPFAVSPFGPGTYIIQAFYDYTGEFLPTFKFRELPEMGDIGGGYIDTTDAILHADAGVDYKPKFLPITVGVRAGTADAGPDAAVGAGLDGGSLVIPPSGYVANNITVSVGEVLPIPRPYFYAKGVTGPASQSMATTANPSGNPDYVPAVTMAQDIQILAQPPMDAMLETTVPRFQASLASITFNAGVPSSELESAISSSDPFQFQLTKKSNSDSLFTWTDGTAIPENSLLSNLLPQVVFTKLIDDPDHTLDPQGIIQQVPPTGPVVVVLGLTLPPTDALLGLLGYPVKAPGPAAATDHITALIRPVAVCVDPTKPEQGATLVAPHFTGANAEQGFKCPNGPDTCPLFDPDAVIAALTPIFGKINTPVTGCLPPGRYAPNFVYPTGQAWTVPNESGSCAVSEGEVTFSSSAPTGARCTLNGVAGRDVLFSQGPRSVLEITASPGSTVCADHPVPSACLP